MHRDELADLGESLRRELQDLVSAAPAALAGLEEDARRLLAALDGDPRELGAWLTSASLEVDLPEEADEAPARRAPERGAREADGQGRTGTYTDGFSRDSAAVPLETAASGAGVPRQQPPAAALAPVKSLRDLAQWVREASVGEGEPERENSPLSEPGAVSTATAGESVSVRVRPGKPAAAASRASAEISGAAEAASGAPEGESFVGVGAGRGTPPLAGLTLTPQPLSPLLPPTDRERGASRPSAAVFSLFSRWTGGRPGEEGWGDEGQLTENADAPERGDARLGEPGVLPTYLQRHAPAPPPAAIRGASPAPPPPAASPAGELTPPPFPEAAAEVDVESLLEALARSVADEYKRFYGS